MVQVILDDLGGFLYDIQGLVKISCEALQGFFPPPAPKILQKSSQNFAMILKDPSVSCQDPKGSSRILLGSSRILPKIFNDNNILKRPSKDLAKSCLRIFTNHNAIQSGF